jgi:hypothetical protein
VHLPQEVKLKRHRRAGDRFVISWSCGLQLAWRDGAERGQAESGQAEVETSFLCLSGYHLGQQRKLENEVSMLCLYFHNIQPLSQSMPFQPSSVLQNPRLPLPVRN